ncbi:MAG TPA: hypothetical protein VFJ19_04295 [Nocardioidaceae bacterium]|nr:hypothetical protein [Nocardioidaceae bacterium]
MAVRKTTSIVMASVAAVAAIVIPAVLVSGGHGSGGKRGISPVSTNASGASPKVLSNANPVVIDSSIPETFTRANSNATAPMSADAVFTEYAKANGSALQRPPSNVNVQLGYLTLAVGAGDPGAYTAKDELVWSFSSSSCPPNLGMVTPAPSSNPCVEWLFLDATTGQEIDDTWQQ